MKVITEHTKSNFKTRTMTKNDMSPTTNVIVEEESGHMIADEENKPISQPSTSIGTRPMRTKKFPAKYNDHIVYK